MNIKIKANHGVEMTEAIKNYSEEKIWDAVSKFADIIGVDLELGKTNSSHHKGEIYKASAKIIVRGNDIFVENSKNDLYAAIDGIKDKIENEMSSQKDKKKTIFKRMGHKMKNLLKFGRE
jgi:putative sigma-54 modulation protein